MSTRSSATRSGSRSGRTTHACRRSGWRRMQTRTTHYWTVNCLVCHTAEIDGVAYLGAGTKTFDELWLGEALKQLTSHQWRSLMNGTPGDEALAADASRILNSHHH